jgi:hypothetical protein
MKKLFFIAGLVFAGMTANAQIYAGGSFNFRVGGTQNDNGDNLSTTVSFGLYPEVGYYISDRWDAGVNLGVRVGSDKNHVSGAKTKTNSWQFSPYARFAVIRAGDFEVLGKGSVFFNGGKNDRGIKYFGSGVEITPILAYNLNEHITLQAILNFASYGSTYTKNKDGDAAYDFNVGFNTNNVAGIGDLTVGFIYKF